MILPTKHIALSESIIGLAGYLLTLLKGGSYSIDMIWNRLANPQNDIDACFTRLGKSFSVNSCTKSRFFHFLLD